MGVVFFGTVLFIIICMCLCLVVSGKDREKLEKELFEKKIDKGDKE